MAVAVAEGCQRGARVARACGLGSPFDLRLDFRQALGHLPRPLRRPPPPRARRPRAESRATTAAAIQAGGRLDPAGIVAVREVRAVGANRSSRASYEHRRTIRRTIRPTPPDYQQFS
uniref:Uncharacterized protein n=1 Tax=Streptomyces auratus AGR0001 TaxID=1160718 RepID=J1RVJ9_9ACTN